MLCCAHASTVHGKVLRESQAFSCFHIPPGHVYHNTEGFLLTVAALPCELGSFLALCLCSHPAPFSLDSVRTMGHCRTSQAWHSSGGPCLAPPPVAAGG